MSTDLLASLLAFPTALLTLGAGVAAGAGIVLFSARPAAQASPTPRADLLARRDSLYAQLKEHDDTRDKVDPELYASEREKLLAAAAAVLQALDATPEAAPAPPPTAAPRAPTWFDAHPRLTSALWGLGAAGLVLGLKAALDEYARPRAEGQSLTGGQAPAADPGAPDVPPAVAAELAALEARVAANPADIAAADALAHAYIGVGQVMEAWKLSETVVAVAPDDPEARVHQAVTLLHIGDDRMAVALLDKVLADHPDQAEALGYRGVQMAKDGDRDGAVALFTRGRAADPAQAETFNTLIAQVDRMVAAGAARRAAPAAPGEGAAGGGAEPAAGGTPAAGAPVGAVEFAGEVTLAEGVPAEGTLFIYVRPEGVTAGPPLRVKKLPASFPMKFEIGPGDSPMGGSLPAGRVQLSARLDADGNVMTKTPTDPVAVSEPVSAGAAGIRLHLAPGR